MRLTGGSVLWQKERLLNRALAELPPSCDRVAWLDADILFESEDWAQAACAALETAAVVQLFDEVRYLSDSTAPEPGVPASIVHRRESASAALRSGRPLDFTRPMAPHGPAPGFAWAARRELLSAHGLYDAMPLGGGDRAMLSAACGLPEAFAGWLPSSQAHRRHFLAWAEPFARAVGGRVEGLPGAILHLWHGDLDRRAYGDRYAGFEQFAFDPDVDLALTPDGAWRWASDKPALHHRLRRYFGDRSAPTPAAALHR